MESFRIYLITDPAIGDVPRAVQAALGALPRGAAAVQFRDRAADGREALDTAEQLADIARAHGAPLMVNDRVDVAMAAGADGVHLRRDSASVPEARVLGARRIGVSTHTIEEVRAAAAESADFVVFGPVFESPGKGAALGLEALRTVAQVGIPVFALGGVDADNARACMRAGAAGVACIRAVLAAPDPAVAARRMFEAVCA